MKRNVMLLSSVIVLIASWTLLSFKSVDNDKVEVTISSKKTSKFDLHMYVKGGKDLKGLTTPYTFTVDEDFASYIIKSAKPKSEIQMEVKRNGKTSLTASWSLIVLTKKYNALETFGFTE